MNNATHATPQTRYPAFLRHAHWATAALIVLAYLSIYARKWLERGSPERLFMVESHFLLGLLVLLITLPRIAARLRRAAPPIVPTPSRIERLAAHSAHLAMFIFLVIQPVLGVAARVVSGKGIGLPLTDWSIPGLAVAHIPLAKFIEECHETVGVVFIAVLVAHVLAAVWHWKVRRDNTLQRML